jgi:hypothetical protein
MKGLKGIERILIAETAWWDLANILQRKLLRKISQLMMMTLTECSTTT